MPSSRAVASLSLSAFPKLSLVAVASPSSRALASLSFASSLVRGHTYARWLLLLWRRSSKNSVKRKFGIAPIAPIQNIDDPLDLFPLNGEPAPIHIHEPRPVGTFPGPVVHALDAVKVL